MKQLLIALALTATSAFAAAPMCHPKKAPTYLIPNSAEWIQFYGDLSHVH